MFFNISYSECLLVINSLRLCISEKVTFVLQYIFTLYRILVDSLIFQNFKDIAPLSSCFHCLRQVTCSYSYLCSSIVKSVLFSRYIQDCLFIIDFKSFKYHGPWCSSLHVSCSPHSFCFLDLWVYGFHWNTFSTPLFFSPWGLQVYVYRPLEVVLQLTSVPLHCFQYCDLHVFLCVILGESLQSVTFDYNIIF